MLQFRTVNTEVLQDVHIKIRIPLIIQLPIPEVRSQSKSLIQVAPRPVYILVNSKRMKMSTNGHSHTNERNSGTFDPEKMSRGDAIDRIRSAGAISMSPELFEKLYLSPVNAVKGDLRKTFGNPTPIAIVGFLISLTPLSCDLMGWRGAGGSGAASMYVSPASYSP
jgi:hypothetical protein